MGFLAIAENEIEEFSPVFSNGCGHNKFHVFEMAVGTQKDNLSLFSQFGENPTELWLFNNEIGGFCEESWEEFSVGFGGVHLLGSPVEILPVDGSSHV